MKIDKKKVEELREKNMGIKTLISSNPDFKKDYPKDEPFLNVAEFFMDTIQGEGLNIGIPAAFLRLQGCTLNCVWCDTVQVWRFGNPYTFPELFKIMEESGLINRLRNPSYHLILTGGSPLLQQRRLIPFLDAFVEKYGFTPYIEIENECTLMPKPELEKYISLWNNSPKLSNNGMKKEVRHKPRIIKYLSTLPNATFKFVVNDYEDWQEIKDDFLEPGLVKPEQVFIMPMGENQKLLEETREMAINMAVDNSWRFTERQHIVTWDEKTGV